MSEEDVRRAGVMSRVAAQQLKLVSAAELLGVSYRQAKRIYRRYGEEGPGGLVHRNAGRGSNRRKPEGFRRKVLHLVGEKYADFGPTLAAEHLESEDGLVIQAETLRRWLWEEGRWPRRRKRKPHRQRRARKKHFGELVQLDGSFHEWFEDRGPRSCLMNMVDDATGTTLAQLSEQETIWAAADLLRLWIERQGVPRALYTDWKNVYVRKPNPSERMRGETPQTQFGRMCGRLGIRIIAACSPQAKGRVERNHGVHQDRLIKKLRRKNIRQPEEANRYLREQYLPEHNRRFACRAEEPEDFHLKAPGKRELDRIFRLEEERVVSNDWVVRYHGRYLQIQRESRRAPARGRVRICEARDGKLTLYYREHEIVWAEIATPPTETVLCPAPRTPMEVRRRVHRPAADHPWRKPILRLPPPRAAVAHAL